MTKKKYIYAGYSSPLSVEELRTEDREVQKEIMEEWFRSKYEDPAESLPYEGGYIYIWGGPYYASEELEAEFAGIVPDDVISELSEDLEEENYEWSRIPTKDDYDEALFDIVEGTEFLSNFQVSIENIRELLVQELSATLKDNIYKLLYANVITAMETYLSDAFINTIMNKAVYKRKFVEVNDDFRKEKFSIAEIYTKMETLDELVKKNLIELIYHNLPKVKVLYEMSLDLKFPEDLADIHKAITIRHHIVHRNGKTQDGVSIEVTKEKIEDLLEKVSIFINHIDEQILGITAH